MTHPDPAALFSPDAVREAAHVRGLDALDREDYPEAIKQLKLEVRDIKRHGGSSGEAHRAMYFLGVAYLKDGSRRKAAKYLKAAARLGSRRAAALLRSLE